ncbi:Uncharacterized protein BP5553_01029 [Venustampulla echinocandica]|uniref:sn-1-specific diacylglycerol lipase n=1 Tax=Venustampulla echinocandica TaxID=2656787 RepID=A0A370TZW2_9HELO|nr:Uncharacterized protein BP5553_01029 [Venustampulla echinocandica]RDL41050.1 Uncharacterized protein BP5553_01029 [Venustampulla echinocandica]
MEQDQDEDETRNVAQVSAKKQQQSHPTGSTVLPERIASVVSLLTRSSSLYLRLGSFIGGLALDGARVTTLTSLELSRAIIEGILIRSGRDVSSRIAGELGITEAEGILEASIATLHRTITSISFAASTGFQFSAAALNSATDLSQQLLASLDSILGSTDSSRAIASIVTLIRREFQNPATGREGEKVGVADLLMGICGLVLLQRWCKILTDLEYREGKLEEVVWDVVVLDNGRRVDVVGSTEGMVIGRALESPASMSFTNATGDEVLQTIERDVMAMDGSHDDSQEIDLRQRIMRSLPADASISITTSTTTTKIVTVEITGTETLDFSPPPGVEVIEENVHLPSDVIHDTDYLPNSEASSMSVPRHRVVYRIVQDNLGGTSIEPKGLLEDIETAVDDDEINVKGTSLGEAIKTRGSPVSRLSSPGAEEPPELPLKPSPSTLNTKHRSSLYTTSPRQAKGAHALATPGTNGAENVANEKRSRKATSSSSASGSDNNRPKKLASTKLPLSKRAKQETPSSKSSEKKGSFRNALKKGSNTTLSQLWSKDPPALDGVTQIKVTQKPPWGVSTGASSAKPQVPVPARNSSIVRARDAPGQPQRGNPNYFSSRDLGQTPLAETPQSPSRRSYYSVHEQRRDSVVSQTDTYSIHSTEARPESPSLFRTHLKTQGTLLRARSEKNIVQYQLSSGTNHRRARSHVPSIYTLKTNDSATSLILASRPRRSVFESPEALATMGRTGFIDGLFPARHIVRNITRFIRFASASYGASFLRVVGIAAANISAPKEIDLSHPHEHHSFSTHTQLPADTILLSSFVDPQGGTDSTGNTNTGVPMVHFVSLDHDSKAVVLTCRGTLGFEDVLTDMTCDYDTLTWRGHDYSVHKGIHASARRLLDGAGSRVMATIAAALEEFPDYGLVMCGHSLGGGVTALLAIMISEPSPDTSPAFTFITSSEISSPATRLLATKAGEGSGPSTFRLPPGRPIHVYAYGPPSTLSPSLRLATRGLITTIINGQDLVPYLSLGVLHDLQAVALAFKTDDSGAKGEVRNRVWAGITGTFKDKWYSGDSGSTFAPGTAIGSEEDDQWAYSALKALRACMLSPKLVPPGEVFVVESSPVLKRDAFVKTNDEADDPRQGRDLRSGSGLGRPAVRTVVKYVRDVEKRFGEVKFGGSMLLDHSPARYEASLSALRRGVLG